MSRSDDLPFDKKRVIVLHEAGWTCAYCGLDANEVDHIWPKRWGGTDDLGNLQALCRSCNARKGDRIFIRDFTPLRCGWRLSVGIDGLTDTVRHLAAWESIRRAMVEGASGDDAHAVHMEDGDKPTDDAIRWLLSYVWQEVLHETPGQAALDALAELDRFHLIDTEDTHA